MNIGNITNKRRFARSALAALAAAIVLAGTLPAGAAAQRPATALQAQAVAGTWSGDFLGTVFTFEFRQVGGRWTGRYQSAKYRVWHDVKNLSVANGQVRFEFASQPKIAVTLRGTGAKSLSGMADVAGRPGIQPARIPITLGKLT